MMSTTSWLIWGSLLIGQAGDAPLFQARPLTAEGSFTPGIEGPATNAAGEIFAPDLAPDRFGYAHLITGTLESGDFPLSTGDGLKAHDAPGLRLTATGVAAPDRPFLPPHQVGDRFRWPALK